MQPANSDTYLKLLLDSDMLNRQNGYANYENHRPNLKRYPDFTRPDRDDKCKFSEISQKIHDVVLGSQLLNACKDGNNKEADEALSKISSYDSLNIEDKDKRTAFSYALSNGMKDVAVRIQTKIRQYYYNAQESGDLATMANIRQHFALNDLLSAKSPHESLNLNRKIDNVILGSQLINACKKEKYEKALMILANITSYDGLNVLDENKKNVLYYVPRNIEAKIMNKIRGFYIDALRTNDSNTSKAIEAKFDPDYLFNMEEN